MHIAVVIRLTYLMSVFLVQLIVSFAVLMILTKKVSDRLVVLT